MLKNSLIAARPFLARFFGQKKREVRNERKAFIINGLHNSSMKTYRPFVGLAP